jgi:hypothetical protein
MMDRSMEIQREVCRKPMESSGQGGPPELASLPRDCIGKLFQSAMCLAVGRKVIITHPCIFSIQHH